MNLEQELSRAREATRWLEDAFFKAAREDVYAQLKAARSAAPLAATELHSKLILMEQCADRFFGYFDQLAQTGKFAKLELDAQESRFRAAMEHVKSFATFGRNGL